MVLELWAQLVGGVERVVLDDNTADLLHSKEGGDVLRAVRQHDRHAVTRANAKGFQTCGGAAHLAIELAKRLGAAEEPGGGVVAVGGQVVVVKIVQRAVAVLQRVGGPLGVVLQPGGISIGWGG